MAHDPEIVTYDNTAETEKPRLEVTTEEAKLSTKPYASKEVQQIGKRVSDFLSDLPDYVTNFFGEYQRPLLTVGAIVAALVAAKLALALLDAINDIPLIQPTFELIGIIYTSWFVYRYLLSAASRQELFGEINTFKEQILGKID